MPLVAGSGAGVVILANPVRFRPPPPILTASAARSLESEGPQRTPKRTPIPVSVGKQYKRFLASAYLLTLRSRLRLSSRLRERSHENTLPFDSSRRPRRGLLLRGQQHRQAHQPAHGQRGRGAADRRSQDWEKR